MQRLEKGAAEKLPVTAGMFNVPLYNTLYVSL